MPAERSVRRAESWRVYRLLLALGGAGIAVCALVLVAGISSVHVQPGAAHRVTLAGVRLTYPVVNAAAALLLGLAIVGAVVLLHGVRAAWHQARRTRSLIRGLSVLDALPGYPAVLVIDASVPIAFCAGWIRPRVYVSRAVIDRLTDRELVAVLAHEQQHGVLRDPLRLAVGRVLSQSLFFLPVLRSLNSAYEDAAELTADAAALEVLEGAAAPLASAMLALGGAGGDAVSIAPHRVDALLGLPAAWQRPRLLLVASLVTLGLMLTLVWQASANASVQATLNLPLASSQPCILVLALIPLCVCLMAALIRRPAL